MLVAGIRAAGDAAVTPVTCDDVTGVTCDVVTPVTCDVVTPVTCDDVTPVTCDVVTPVTCDVVTHVTCDDVTPVTSDVVTPVTCDVVTPVTCDDVTPVTYALLVLSVTSSGEQVKVPLQSGVQCSSSSQDSFVHGVSEAKHSTRSKFSHSLTIMLLMASLLLP